MASLTVRELAELKGCSEQYIRKQISAGDIQAAYELNEETGLMQYSINPDLLPPALFKRYRAKLAAKAPLPALTPNPRRQKAFDAYSAEERKQITFWSNIVEEWLRHRETFDRKTDADPLFVASLKLRYRELSISEGTLYRRLKAYKEGDLDGLTDRRGGWNRGKSAIDPELKGTFERLYLQDQQLPISQCYRFTVQWAKEMRPELVATMPSEQSFRRLAAAIPEPVVAMGRYGHKYYDDKWMPYLNRLYDELHANDVWIADNHTLDITTQSADGEHIHRLSFTGYTDALSGIIVGGNLTDNPCSQSTVLALRNCIINHGIPLDVYVDNGREFLTHDVGGRGHRAKKSDDLINDPPPIFKRLGITMTNAIVRNAKAKNIERTFGTLKNQFSRCFETFTGGNVMEKPESLKYTLKKGEVPFDAQIRDLIFQWIDIFNNQEYGGPLKKYKGMTRLEVWNASIAEVGMRTTDKANLALMLMRSTRPQKVRRTGVYIAVCGERLQYWDKETLSKYQGREVYVRYDPADLSTVRIYDAGTDTYLQTVPMALDTMLLFRDTSENISIAQEKVREVKKQVKGKLSEYKNQVPPDRRLDILYLMSRQADAARTGTIVQQPPIIIPVSAGDEEPLKKAVGENVMVVDINMERMNRAAAQRKK